MIIPDLRSAIARLPLWLCAVVLLPAFTFPDNLLAAQKSKEKPYALIVGTVWGPDNRPVYGVPVKIRRSKDKKPKWEVYSDHLGEFAQRLPPATLITSSPQI